MKTSPSTYPLRLPRSIKTEVERRAKSEGVSVNQFVATAVAPILMRSTDWCAVRAVSRRSLTTRSAEQAEVRMALRLCNLRVLRLLLRRPSPIKHGGRERRTRRVGFSPPMQRICAAFR